MLTDVFSRFPNFKCNSIAPAVLHTTMGLFFTLLYILTAYLGPQTLFGALADYHVQVIIFVIAMMGSILSVQGSGISRISQSYSLLMMCAAVFLSFIFNRLFGLAPLALLDFVPNAFIFFLVIVNCKKKAHLQAIILTLLFACLFTLVRGVLALNANELTSPYLISQGNDAGDYIIRIRGLSFINDPNDFAQLMVSLIPCLFFFWKKDSTFRNMVVVLIPAAALVYAMFLTHSRGAILALLVVIVFAGRKKIGTVGSLIGGGLLFVLSMAAGWSGGRAISVDSGSDRLEAWSTGLQLIRSHPLFGVGFERFSEYNPITAHNTVVVCAAELGIFGLYFWIMYVFPTFRDMVSASKLPGDAFPQPEVDNALPEHLQRRLAPSPSIQLLHANLKLAIATGPDIAHPASAPAPYYASDEAAEAIPDEELGRLASIMTISLLGYFVAGWFLSRAYVMTLFVYVGIAEVIYSMALNRQIVPPRMKIMGLLRMSAFISIGLIAFVYVMLRVQRMMPH